MVRRLQNIYKAALGAISLICFFSCEGNVIELPPTDGNLNGPLAMVGFESGETITLIVNNTNTDLSSQTGSLSIIEFDTSTAEYSILKSESIDIDSFSGELIADGNELFLANRLTDSVDRYTVSFSDAGEFESVKRNGAFPPIEVGEDPYGLALLTFADRNPLLLTSNLVGGSVSVIDQASWLLVTLDETDFDELKGIVLDTNTANLTPKGRGVAEIASIQNGKFAIVISQTFNVAYVIDTETQSLEGYIFTDNRNGAATGGLRGIAVDSNDTIYLASRDGDQILQLDGSRIADNGIDHDRIDYLLADSWTLLGKNPSDIKLSPDEQFLYVTSVSDNFLEIVDIDSQTTVKRIDTEIEPTKMTIAGDFLFISNFGSNSISVIDVNTQELVQTIK